MLCSAEGGSRRVLPGLVTEARANDKPGLGDAPASVTTSFAPQQGGSSVGSLLYKSWADVPAIPPQDLPRGSVFVEVFSGKAWLTRAMRRRGWSVLPPIDIVVDGDVLAPADILDPGLMAKVQAWISSGIVGMVHFGTPCTTFSRARRNDGGPPPIRSETFLQGIPGIDPSDQSAVDLGTKFLDITLQLARLIQSAGGVWTIENPLSSMLWLMPQTILLLAVPGVARYEIDMCMFGGTSQKPTLFVCSQDLLSTIVRRCCGQSASHVHVTLKGKVLSDGKWVYRTKLAQVYPHALCDLYASAAASLRGLPPVQPFPPVPPGLPAPSQQAVKVREDPLLLGSSAQDGRQFALSFAMVTPSAERKRVLGTECRFREHRQSGSGRKAIGAGYQMRRGLVPPLFLTEVEPGEALRIALEFVHPFTQEIELDEAIDLNICRVCSDSAALVEERHAMLQYWSERALALIPISEAELRLVPDALLRRLLRGVPDCQPVVLGKFFHIALWRALARAGGCKDQHLIEELLAGMTIVGEVGRSGRWPPMVVKEATPPVQTLLDRAWDIRDKILRNVGGSPLTSGSKDIWDSTIEDRDEGSCIGPFWSVDEVSQELNTEEWVPTQRFEVRQKNKVRGCDSATVNMVNQVTRVTEKLQLPTADANVAALRKLRSKAGGKGLFAWVLDERKAYRQIGVRPDQRKFSVVAFRHFETGKIAFFIMVGHSFGLVSAVYNYNRRSALLDEFLRKVFKLVSFNFYDDKFGFETEDTIGSAFACAESVHFWLGAQFDAKKLQLGQEVDILGITYDLINFILKIKDSRKAEIVDEIRSIVELGFLEPGRAGKLKGKLMFGASQLWGKVGRAFLLALSERQYARGYDPAKHAALGQPLLLALSQWSKLISNGPPREITELRPAPSQVVIFTDGYTPDQRKGEVGLSKVGATMFDRSSSLAAQFCEVVPQEVIDKWLPRATQICMVELVATVLALQTFKDYLRGMTVLLLVDAEAVEGALVKGYSARSDLCELVGVFWDLVLELKALVYIDRVPTDANCSDAPSRDKLAIGAALGWKTVLARWPLHVWSQGRAWEVLA